MSMKPRRKFLFLFLSLVVVGLCLVLPAVAITMQLREEPEPCTAGTDYSFSMLILGDSQMSGEGWKGGYANCISDTYPHAQALNLAQSGSLLSNGDILKQWEFYCSEFTTMPDYVLLDGGVNDLSQLRKEEFRDTGFSLVNDSLCTLLEQIHADSPDTRILYLLMPPLAEWTETEDGPPSYDAQAQYWKKMSSIAGAYDYVTVLDLFSVNPFRFPCADCYQEYFADSVHLNEAGYRKSFVYIDNALVAHLAQQAAE